MSEQLSFPGFGTLQGLPQAQRLPNGLFFALAPPILDLPRIMNFVQRLRMSVGSSGTPLSAECLHVSLFDLGAYFELPKEIVAAARAAGTKVSAPAFDMILDRALTFPRKKREHPFVLRPGDEIAALAELHKTLRLVMRKSGLKSWATSSFTPHMTLSYDREIISERTVETVRWRVSEVVLVHSLRGRGPGRNEHIHLARWPLQE